MQKHMNKLWIVTMLVLAAMVMVPKTQFAQETKKQALDQNISIYAEDEPLSDIIEKICNYLNLD